MLYLTHPSGLEHDPRAHMPAHPDTPERLIAIERAVADREWPNMERRQAPAAEERELELVHSAHHVESIRELCLAGGGAIDADTFVGEASYRAALHAAGRRLRDDAGAARRRGQGGVLRAAPIGPSRRTGAGDGLLPLRQRRDRRRAG